MHRQRPSIRFARMLELRSPRLAARIGTTRVSGAARSMTAEGGIEYWTPTPGAGSAHPAEDDRAAPLILVIAERPVTARWISASLAVALQARVMVARADALTGDDMAVAAIVGMGDAADAAIALCRHLGAARLALISPVGLPTSVPSGLPTTLIQSSSSGEHRPAVEVFERTLRATGTAVRDTDYPSIPDEWVRLPRLVRGSTAALGDLIAFLERGIGVQSTFEVIPGWDLH